MSTILAIKPKMVFILILSITTTKYYIHLVLSTEKSTYDSFGQNFVNLNIIIIQKIIIKGSCYLKTRKRFLAFSLAFALTMTSLPVQLFAQTTKDASVPISALVDTQTTTPGAIQINPNKYVGDGYEVEFKVVNQWPGAFQGEFVLTNTSDKPLENWTLKFDFEHEITNMWNAQIVTHEANSYIIKNMGHNQDITPGSSVNIGFQANCSEEINIPESYDLLIAKQEVGETDYTIDFKVISDWGQAFNGEISITNNTEEAIEDWTLEFDFDRNIERFWTAEIVEHEGEHYIIKNAGYNANIAPEQTITLGFSGNPGNVDSEPTNYVLNQLGQIEKNVSKIVINQDKENSGEYIVGTEDILIDGYIEGEEKEKITEIHYELINSDDEIVTGIAEGTLEWKVSDLPITLGQNQLQIKAITNGQVAINHSLVIDYVSTELQMAEELYIPTRIDADAIIETIVGVWEDENNTSEDTIENQTVLLVKDSNPLLEALKMGELAERQVVFIPPNEENPMPFAKVILGYAKLSDDLTYNNFDSGLREKYPPEEYDDDLYYVIYTTEASLKDLFNSDMRIRADQINLENPIAFSTFDSDLVVKDSNSIVENNTDNVTFATRTSLNPANMSRGEFFAKQIANEFKPIIDGNNSKIDFLFGLKDTVIYDDDKDLKTKNDQMKITGTFGLRQLAPKFEYTWKGTILPEQMRYSIECGNVSEFSVSYAGKFNIEDLTKGLPKFKNKRDLSLAVFDYTIAEGTVQGVDMSNNFVIGCVGINLKPVFPVGYTVTNIEGYSQDHTLDPIAVVMLTMNLEGKIECTMDIVYKFNETYKTVVEVVDSKKVQSTSNAIDVGFDKKLIYSQTKEPAEHEFYIEGKGEATVKSGLEGQVGVMLGGIMPTTLGLGVEMGATAEMDGKIEFIPKFNVVGSVKGKTSVDAFAELALRLKAKTTIGDAKIEWKDYLFKTNLYSREFEWTSAGITGRIYDDRTKEQIDTEAITDTPQAILENRKPLADVEITVEGKGKSLKAKTDASGNYKLNNLQPGEYIVTYLKNGYSIRKIQVNIGNETRKLYVNMNRKKYDISGTIKDTNYNLVPEAKVTIVPKEKYISQQQIVMTDANGVFKVQGLIAGTYEIFVEKAGYITAKYSKSSNFHVPLDLKIAKCSGSKLHGKIIKADDDMDMSNNTPLADVTVKIWGLGQNWGITQAVSTNANGMYMFTDLPLGEYKLVISKTGYMEVEEYVTVDSENTITYNLALELISNYSKGNGTVQGTIRDAQTGTAISHYLQIKVRKGINNTRDKVSNIINTKNGAYSIVLPAGNYTLEVLDISTDLPDESLRYSKGIINVKVLGNKTIRNQDGVLSRRLKSNQIRIVLRWGATPSDLDAHLVGPSNISGDRFHVFYSNKNYTSTNNNLNVDLDVDDTSSYGPETITLTNPVASGVRYAYYVHDYSNKHSSDSSELSFSNAVVEVYTSNSSTPKVFSVPTNPGKGTLWKVFEYDPNTHEIIPVNIMKYQSNPSQVGYSLISTDEQELDEEVQMILDDIEYSVKE